MEEIKTVGDSFELQAVTAEARRMRAERETAALVKEQVIMFYM